MADQRSDEMPDQLETHPDFYDLILGLMAQSQRSTKLLFELHNKEVGNIKQALKMMVHYIDIRVADSASSLDASTSAEIESLKSSVESSLAELSGKFDCEFKELAEDIDTELRKIEDARK